MITIILQAGGESSRMGQDKALLPFLGIPLIQRLLDRFHETGDELLVICRNFPGYGDLGVPLHRDVLPGRGALGGLLTALTISSFPLVGIIAADLPFADPTLIKTMSALIQDTQADAIIPSTTQGLEPMHAIYRREICLPLVQKAIDQNLWRLNAWHQDAKIQILDPEETRRISGSPFTFLNVNTPEDFQHAEEIAREFNL
ncbi:MAG: molybdenum cofactor guanylyltransferase [Anaerolineales bacterium]|nr:MAG: molybdenum cofactor guanylyltransferase [Anaerolineales bacterium]